jgi:hypothetical protein
LVKAAGFTHEKSGVEAVDWYTPPWIFDRMGLRFDLDPCQPEIGVPWIPATRRYTLLDDGLTSPWGGRVWLNPPYGKHTAAWLAKMHAHGNGIALVFARTDCAWFHEYIAKADAVLFLRGRIKFVAGAGNAANGGPGNGSLLAAWGQDSVSALVRMSDLGHLAIKEDRLW